MVKASFRVALVFVLTGLACAANNENFSNDISDLELGDTTDVADVADTSDVADVADTSDVLDFDEAADVGDSADSADMNDDLGADDSADSDDAVDVADLQDTTEVIEPEPDPTLPMRAEGWLRGDLHTHTTHSDGEDSVGVVVSLAEYFQTELFLNAHPEYAGNHLDFLAITDHCTITQNSDPDFYSDSVIMIRGEEFGAPGHANIWDLDEFVPHKPDGSGPTTESYQAGPGLAHAQGALFSINHPMVTGIPFPWDIRDHDAMEVINTGWGMLSDSYDLDMLQKWEQQYGPSSPIYRKALEYPGLGFNGAALRFYEAQLTRGIHVALVAGSDRHKIFPVGSPTTWVHTQSDDVSGIMDGIRARHTFVSRNPAAATVEMTVVSQDKTYAMGDKISIGDETEATVDVTIRVRRAEGARVRLIQGVGVKTDEELADVELGTLAHEVFADSNDFETTVLLTVHPGDWFYPVVHERLISPDLDPELAAMVPDMLESLGQVSHEDYMPLISVLAGFIDPMALLNAAECDPKSWQTNHAQCMPPDDNGYGTFFIPDWINRVFSIIREGGETTDWCMGAIGSACLVQGAYWSHN